MLLRISVLLFFSCCVFSGRAQLNPYKYIVVPTHFEAFKKVNQHQTSTIVKYYLTENGFPAVYDTQQPTELRIDPCQAAYVKLRDDSGMFMTRVALQFVDCQGEVVFETMEGTSKEKDYADAYKGAIAEAFQSLAGMGYSYTPGAGTAVSDAVSGSAEAAPVSEPPAGQVREEESATAMESARALEAAREAIPQRPESPVSGNVPAASRPDTADPGGSGADTEPRVSGASSHATDSGSPAPDSGELLYAQEIENGFQLVDSTPKIRMKLMKTSQADRYIVVVDGETRGMLYQQDDFWIHEFYDAGKLRTERIRIKF
ncbi:hypothetical protein [Robiginitalea biformata]|uniref:hypothetical protein n=1 Tax=Robiginitalea biformata TaxID=252307 RepID=UPI0003220086|nr:hypothetical protein [Robiginitalea biformata]